MKITIQLPKQIDDDLAADLEKQGVYAAPGLTRIKVTADRTAVAFDGDGDEAEVRPKLERYLTAMVSRYRKIPSKVIHKVERHDDGALETDVYAKLLARGWAIEFGMGQVGFAGPAFSLL